jgi:mannose-6-phosphate isomerase-like protein (cupin superfamily)
MQQGVRARPYQFLCPFEGRVLKIGDMLVTIKVTGAETNGAFAVFEVTAPPHFPGVPAYLHPRATETFYVINGVLAFTLAEETVMVRSGGLITVPPGLLHKFWNPTAAPVTYLTYLSPAGLEQYLIELAAILANAPAASPTDLSQIRALAAKHELLLVDQT